MDKRQEFKLKNMVGSSPAMGELFFAIKEYRDFSRNLVIQAPPGTEWFQVIQNLTSKEIVLCEKVDLNRIQDQSTHVFLNLESYTKTDAQNIYYCLDQDLSHFYERGCNFIFVIQDKNALEESLIHRLNQLAWVSIPKVADRLEDIHQLITHYTKSKIRFTKNALVQLMNHDWPNNIEEIKEFCAEMELLGKKVIDESDLPQQIILKNDKFNDCIFDNHRILKWTDAHERFSQMYLNKLLNATNHNKLKASKLSGMGRSQLYKKIEEFGIRKLEDD